MTYGVRNTIMIARALALTSVLLFPLSLYGRTRAVHHPANASAAPASVLWVAAHPDDEAVAAPLLAKWCVEDGARCAMLVLTRGEAGACLLPDGCAPDVRSVRSAEAGAASALFNAESILLRYPDGGGASPPLWDRAELTARIANEIEAFRPDRILTFDPRHGTTCHPDHQETGSAVLEAAKQLSYRPEVYLLETSVRIAFDPVRASFSPAIAGAERFEAVDMWDWVAADMARHPSQFPAEWLDAVRNVPAQDRAVFIAPAAAALQQPAGPCP